MITKEILLNRQEKWSNLAKESIDYESPIVPLFVVDESFIEEGKKLKNYDADEFIFNPKNWNGGDDLIRQLTTAYEYYGLKDEYNNIQLIYTRTIDDKSLSVVIKDGHEKHIATIVWYKDRGTTENLLWDGRPMDMEQYLILLNKLEENNVIKFDLDVK